MVLGLGVVLGMVVGVIGGGDGDSGGGDGGGGDGRCGARSRQSSWAHQRGKRHDATSHFASDSADPSVSHTFRPVAQSDAAGKCLKKRTSQEEKKYGTMIRKIKIMKKKYWQQWRRAVFFFFCLSCLVSQNVYRLTLFNRETRTTFTRKRSACPMTLPPTQPITRRR